MGEEVLGGRRGEEGYVHTSGVSLSTRDVKLTDLAAFFSPALELLVQTLRSQLARLTHDLTSQRNLITQLQNQRSLDAAEINRRGEEVERLRQEVSKLAEEVGGLRRAVEGRDSGRREAQTSPLLAQQDMERERERAIAGLGFDPSRVEEQQEEQTQRVQQTRERVVSVSPSRRSLRLPTSC